MQTEITIEQGALVDLSPTSLGVGLGWDVDAGKSQFDYDLDAWAFLLKSDGQVPNEDYVVFYNNLVSPDGAVALNADHRVSYAPIRAGLMTACEIITVNLEKVNPAIQQIVFAVGIYKAEQRKQTFGEVRDSFIRIQDPVKGVDICRYELHEDFSVETAVEFGRLKSTNSNWVFEASGVGFEGGIVAAVKSYARNHVESSP